MTRGADGASAAAAYENAGLQSRTFLSRGRFGNEISFPVVTAAAGGPSGGALDISVDVDVFLPGVI